MFIRALLPLVFSLVSLAFAAPARNLIIDHDGGSDDFAAITLAMRSPGVNVRAVFVCPADSYKGPATQITLALVDLLGGRDVRVGAGDDEGPNPFPSEWRQDSCKLAKLPKLSHPSAVARKRLLAQPAPAELVRLLSGTARFDLLFTGPLTNLAAALRQDPKIATRVNRVYFMGGALDVVGNVHREGGEPVAEWNVFNNPRAVNEVLRAGLPVTFVPLDATNLVPITKSFLSSLAGQRRYGLSRLLLDIWGTVHSQIEPSDGQPQYFFWDLLAAAVAVDPGVVKMRTRKVRVIEDGPEEGRLIEDPNGVSAQIATDPDPARLDQLVLRALRR